MRANRYVSYLATEIEPRAFTTLAKFEQATENAFNRVSKFNTSPAARIGLNVDQRSLRSLVQANTALGQTATAAGRASPALRQVSRDSHAMATGLERSAQSLTVVQGALGPVAGRLSALGAIFRNLSGVALTGVLGGAGAFALAGVASDYQRVTDRLRPFYETQQQTNTAMKEVIGIARETRQALDPVAALYSRLGQAAKDAKLNIDQSAVTRTVARAARLSGGDAQTQQAGITQFLQGFGSGTLNGDELKSIRENTFRLAKAIADGLGVPIAKLKELGAEGKLTPKVISEALKRSADSIDVEFSRLPLRIDQALQQSGNNLSVFIGQLDQATGATNGIAKGIAAVGNNLDTATVALAAFLALYTGRKLSAPLEAASGAISRQVSLARQTREQERQSNIPGAGGGFTRLTPEGIARAKANTAVVDAAAAVGAARTEQTARLQNVAALDAEANALKQKHAGMVAEVRDAQASAAANVALARARVDAATAGLAAVRDLNAQQARIDADAARQRVNGVKREVEEAAQVRAAAERRVAAARISGEQVAADPNLSRGNRNRQLGTAAQAQALAEREVAAAMTVETAAAERLAAAQNELAAARARAQVGAGALRTTAAEAQAVDRLADAQRDLGDATRTQAQVERQAGAASREAEVTGFKRLSIIEARVKAEAAAQAAIRATANAEAILTQRSLAAATAQGVYERSLGALSKAKALATTASQKLYQASASLAGALGGPVGIALTAVTIGMTLLATQTDEARAAAQRFKDEQDAMAERLGKTTAALATQTAAARELRLALAEANVEEARKKRTAAETQLGQSLAEAQGRYSVNPFDAQSRSDFRYLGEVAADPSKLRLNRLRQIRERDPNAFVGDAFSNILGSDPGETRIRAVGLVQTLKEQRRAEKAAAQAREMLNKPVTPLKPIDLTGGKGKGSLTTEQLKAYAADAAEGGTVLANARAKFAKQQSDLDAMLKEKRDAGDYSFDDEYVRRLTAARTELNRVGDAQRGAAAGAAANRKAIAAQNVALKEAEARGQKLADIMGRYTDAPTAVKRGENDKRDIDSFFVQIKNGVRTELSQVKVGDQIFTKADAQEIKDRIDKGVRQPITDALRDQDREAQISNLILRGREAEADVLREKFRLVDAVGNITADEEADLRRNLATQRQINRDIEARNRLIDVQARVAGNLQGAFRDALAAPFDAKSLESVGRRLIADFQGSIADKISVTLFGDAEQNVRDKMTGAFEGSADRLNTSADKLQDAAQAIIDSATGANTVGGSLGLGDLDLPGGGDIKLTLPDVTDALTTGLRTLRTTTTEAEPEIVVNGTRGGRRRDDETKMSIESRTNATAREFATKLFGKNSPLTKAAGQLGTFLSGAQYAPVGLGAIQAVTGKRGNELGAIAGGGLGKEFLGGKGGFLEKGLTSLAPQLGQFAGPLGSIAGSIIGSFAADVLGIGTPKTRSGYATISTDQYGTNNSSAAGGKRSEDRIQQAITYADDVLSSLTSIADKFGGRLAAGQNLGTIGSQGDKFVFDPDGAGRQAGVKFSSIEEAQRAAIKNAIDKNIIQGIRAGTQRLLQSGRELETALERAVSFENVFKELKRRKDPVGAAIDELNAEFEKLIGIFNEAGASAAEFADLEELYGLKRADAIKEAANASIESLQSFITGLTASADSPLGRRTAYENAKKNVEGFRTDIAAGKVVDTDKLIEALTNYQNTSAGLNGSRGAFYNDFEQIVALAKSAQANITAGQGTLPKSPFDPAVASDIKKTADGIGVVNDTLTRGLNDVVRAIGQSGGSGSSTVNGASFEFLPYKLAR